MQLTFTFNQKKSTQAGAYLLKANKGYMDKYLWIKMLYLSDREALKKWNDPITGDAPVSMPYGPALSAIYDLTKGDCQSLRDYWGKFISNSNDETNQICLIKDPGTAELSRAEIQILQSVFNKFSKYTWKQMRDYCHRLPEYEDVGEGSKPLHIDKILKVLGKTSAEIHEFQEMYKGIHMAELLLSRSN
ncbi:MAG: Panacea domain-containing protein [Lentisphaerota bacterium]